MQKGGPSGSVCHCQCFLWSWQIALNVGCFSHSGTEWMFLYNYLRTMPWKLQFLWLYHIQIWIIAAILALGKQKPWQNFHLLQGAIHNMPLGWRKANSDGAWAILGRGRMFRWKELSRGGQGWGVASRSNPSPRPHDTDLGHAASSSLSQAQIWGTQSGG